METIDVFICHNSDDKPAIGRIVDSLTHEYGVNCWFDRWNIPGGSSWRKEIEQALAECRTCAVFLGPSGWAEVHRQEAGVAMERAGRNASFRVIPVLLEGARDEDAARQPGVFDALQRADFRPPNDPQEAFRILYAAIQGMAPGPEVTSAARIRRAAQLRKTLPRSDTSILYRGRELTAAQRLAEQHPQLLDQQAFAFISESALEEKRIARRQKLLARGALVVLTILVLLVGIFAIDAYRKRREVEERSAAFRVYAGIREDEVGNEFAALHHYAAAADIEPDREWGRVARSILRLRQQLIAELVRTDQLERAARVALGAGNSMLVTPFSEGVWLWDLERRGPRRRIEEGEKGEMADARFSRDGRWILTSRDGKSFTVRRFAAPGTVACSARFESELVALEVGTNGQYVLATTPHEIGVWDTNECQRLVSIHQSGVSAATLSPNETMFAFGTQGGVVDVISVRDRRRLMQLDHGSAVHAIAFDESGTMLLTAGETSVRIWNRANSAEPLRQLNRGGIDSAVLSLKGLSVAVIEERAAPLLWGPDGVTTPLQPPSGRTAPWVYGVGFDRNSERILTIQDESTILWGAARGERLTVVQGHGGDVAGTISAAVNGRTLVTTGADRKMRQWNLPASSELCRVPFHFGPESSACVDSVREVWRETEAVPAGMGIVFSKSGRLAFRRHKDGSGAVYDETARRLRFQIPEPTGIVAFSGDEKRC